MDLLDRYPEIRQLSIEDKIQLVTALWAEIEGDCDPVVVDPELVAELDRRIAEYERDPSQGSTWEEVRARLLARRGKSAA